MFDKVKESLSKIGSISPTVTKVASVLVDAVISQSAIGTAKTVIQEAIAKKIEGEAHARAMQLLTELHRAITTTIIWQNTLLVLAIGMCYVLKSTVPFYGAYLLVGIYSAWKVIEGRRYMALLWETLSIRKALTQSIRTEIDEELTGRHRYEQAVVEYLGPSLDDIANTIATRLLPDVRNLMISAGLTLVISFVCFRLIAVPYLLGHL